ncbi:MAG: DUF1385 domain-containing protein [Dehalococcoidia bacterium]
MGKPFHYGGQAVIEGVMMLGKKGLAMTVRQPDGRLNTIRQPLARIYRGRLREKPFSRGLISLGETMVLGTRALLRSAEIAAAEEGEEKIHPALLGGTVAVSVTLAVVLFFLVPLLATRFLIDPFIDSALLSVTLEGLVRIAIFIAYIRVIGLIPDIRRVFAYHGAEHKTINAYESGTPLEVEAVRNYPTAHPRCGTSFIVIVLIIAILVFALTDVLLGRPPLWIRMLSRIALIPFIAAIGYEIMKFGAGHIKNTLVRVIIAPGLMLQSLTTREPDDGQLEAAISALNEVIAIDEDEPSANDTQQAAENETGGELSAS